MGAAALTVLLAGAAQAQFGESANGNTGVGNGSGFGMNMKSDDRRHLTPEQAHREQQLEMQYNETMKEKIPDKKASNDPWGNLRAAPAASAATKQK